MADDDFAPPMRLVNFVSQNELEDAKRNRGARVDDGTAQRDRSLFEILKENKDKRDAEFNERFKHRPPKALDEDETEFLDKLEMSKREYERQVEDEEAEQLRNFQVAVAAQSTIVHEVKETRTLPNAQDQKFIGRKNSASRPSGVIIKVMPQAKKAKMGPTNSEESLGVKKIPDIVDAKQPSVLIKPCVEDTKSSSGSIKTSADTEGPSEPKMDEYGHTSHIVANTSLVSYSDESEEDE